MDFPSSPLATSSHHFTSPSLFSHGLGTTTTTTTTTTNTGTDTTTAAATTSAIITTTATPGTITTTTPSPASVSRWWSGSLDSPLGGEGGEEVGGLSGAGGRSPGDREGPGHSRLPSADSGIQADAGWDSLTRSQRNSLTKKPPSSQSPTSPESRTPLKTLTRCLMEPRTLSNRFSWGDISPTALRLSASLRAMASQSDVRMTSDSSDVRPRTLSCDTDDVRGPRESRMTSSFPSGRTRTLSVDVVGRAPTTRGEEVEERRGGTWRRSDNVFSRSVDGDVLTSVSPAPLSSTGSGPAVSGKEQQHSGSGSSTFEHGTGSSTSAAHSDSIARHFNARSDQRSSRPELPGSRSSHVRSEQPGMGRWSGTHGSAVSAASSSAAAQEVSPDLLPGRRVSSESRPTPPLSLLSSSTPVFPSRPIADGGLGSPHGGDRWRGRREVMSPEFRSSSSSQSRDESPSGTLLQRFHLGYPRVVGSAATSQRLAGSGGSPDGESARGHSHDGGHGRPGAGHHSRPRVTPLSVTHLMSGGPGGFSRTRHVQVVQRPVGSTDRTPPKDSEKSCSSPTSQQNSSVSFQRSSPASFSSPAQGYQNSRTPPQGNQRVIKVNTVQSSSPARPQFSVRPMAQLTQPDSPAHAHSSTSSPTPQASSAGSRSASPGTKHLSVTSSSLSSSSSTSSTSPTSSTSASRLRHITPVYRSKLSPVLPRNMLRTRIPLSHSPSPSPSTSSCPGRPIPVMHVDTCRACLKTPISAPGSPSFPLSVGQSRDSSPYTTSSDCSGNVTQTGGASTPDDLKVNGCPLPLLPHEAVLKLLEKPPGAGEGGEGVEERPAPVLEGGEGVPWKERRSRMDTALTWLKGELESLRAMDTALMTQFRRCQDTIESLKQQQQLDLAWGDGEGSEWGWGLDGSELDEEDDAWEDWEIAEFERRWAEDPDSKELEITLAPVTSSDTLANSVTPNDVTSPAETPEEGRKSPSPIKQDVEATL